MSSASKIDIKGHKTAIIIDIIDIKKYRRLEQLIPSADADSLIFEERANEESTPIEKCNEILGRVRQIKAGR